MRMRMERLEHMGARSKARCQMLAFWQAKGSAMTPADRARVERAVRAVLVRAPMITDCYVCGDPVEVGDPVVWDPQLPRYRTTRHAGCIPPSAALGVEVEEAK